MAQFKFKKIISIFLLLFFTWPHVPGAWANTSLPAPSIVHIQVAHGHFEDAVRVKEMIKDIQKRQGINLIFVEGASGKLEPSFLDFFSQKQLNTKMLDALARKGELTGVDLALSENRSLTALGIENPDLYREAYQDLKLMFGRASQIKEFLKRKEANLDHRAACIFSPKLRKLVEEWKKFNSDQRDLFTSVKFLQNKAGLKVGTEKLNLGLIDEMKKLFDRLVDREAKNQNEKKLLREYRELVLLRKLLSMELARGEWKQITSDNFLLNQLFQISYECPEIQTALEFYRLSEKRESAFVGLMKSEMALRGATKAILVTGGFHAQGMSEILLAHGFAYLGMEPHFSGGIGDSLYHEVMLRTAHLEKPEFSEPAREIFRKVGDASYLESERISVEDAWKSMNVTAPDQKAPYFRDRNSFLAQADAKSLGAGSRSSSSGKSDRIKFNADGSRSFRPKIRPFIPSKRYVTEEELGGGILMKNEFKALLGRVDRDEIKMKSFQDFPVVAVLHENRALRFSALKTVTDQNSCPLCAEIKEEISRLMDVGKGFCIVPEKFPYFDDTATVVQLEHRSPQINRDLIETMLQFLYELGPLGFRIGYNHKGAGRKIEHQSFKIFRQEMPIEKTPLKPFLSYDGMQISIVDDFPVQAILIESAGFERLADELTRVENMLDMLRVPFNLFLTRRNDGLVRVFVELRSGERENTKAFPNKFFGVIEASGIALFEHRDDYNRPDLKQALISSYAQITPEADDVEKLSYIYRAHAAVAKIAAVHGYTYDVDTNGNFFYVFRIPETGEVLKYFRFEAGANGTRGYKWELYFDTGLKAAQEYLGGLVTPTQGVDIDENAQIVPVRPDALPHYLVQKIVEGKSADDMVDELLKDPDVDPEKVVKVFEERIKHLAHMIAAGVFDIDFNKCFVNIKGNENGFMGFDISHLRDIFGGVNIFSADGYAEQWEDWLRLEIQQISMRNPNVGKALYERFAGFYWSKEMSYLGLKIPTTPAERIAKPMTAWASELMKLSDVNGNEGGPEKLSSAAKSLGDVSVDGALIDVPARKNFSENPVILQVDVKAFDSCDIESVRARIVRLARGSVVIAYQDAHDRGFGDKLSPLMRQFPFIHYLRKSYDRTLSAQGLKAELDRSVKKFGINPENAGFLFTNRDILAGDDRENLESLGVVFQFDPLSVTGSEGEDAGAALFGELSEFAKLSREVRNRFLNQGRALGLFNFSGGIFSINADLWMKFRAAQYLAAAA